MALSDVERLFGFSVLHGECLNVRATLIPADTIPGRVEPSSCPEGCVPVEINANIYRICVEGEDDTWVPALSYGDAVAKWRRECGCEGDEPDSVSLLCSCEDLILKALETK